MNGPLRLTVLGIGYLGTSHSACLDGVEFDALSVDTDARKVGLLNAGRLPIYEPGLRELPCSRLDSGRPTLTTSYRGPRRSVTCTHLRRHPAAASDHADPSEVHGCDATLVPPLDRPYL